MTQSLMDNPEVHALLDSLAGTGNGKGNERVKTITRRMMSDLFRMIEDLDITPTEFWAGAAYLGALGKSGEVGLVAAGLGIERFLDIRMDAIERQAGIEGGTPRTIEGPLWLAGAPMSQDEARLDDGTEEGEVLFMDGQVRDPAGHPIPHAIVDVWQANTLGGYSFFDPAQKPWNYRRQITTDDQGRYHFRSLMPSGYGCPPEGTTQALLDQLGRHGQRPAHIHFFVSAPGYRKLTTQINIAGDKFLHDDFAFATRDELIPAVERHTDAASSKIQGYNGPYAEITFDFAMNREVSGAPEAVVVREHAHA